jgi:hypothetical protein
METTAIMQSIPPIASSLSGADDGVVHHDTAGKGNATYDTSDQLRRETARGLRYCHQRLNLNTGKMLENSSFLFALIELLTEKGLLTVEELDERKKAIAERLAEQFRKSGLGLLYQDPEYDKYTFEHIAHVDCDNRLHSCNALCCKFPFALSQQDIEEGILHWDFGRPYMIAHNEDGYCVHLDRSNYECTVRDRRPVPCRGFDCRDNQKWPVWLDADNTQFNAALADVLKGDSC